MKTESELTRDGFTITGKTRYLQTVEDYAGKLHEKSIVLGKSDQDKTLPLEITHDHVRKAAFSLATTYGKEKPSGWAVLGNIGEYIFTAAAGIGGGNIKESWGVIVFGISCTITVLLIAYRFFRSK